MYKIYTASGNNQRTFKRGSEAQALKHYESIKNERKELHYLFIAILPENIYSLEGDRKQAKEVLMSWNDIDQIIKDKTNK